MPKKDEIIDAEIIDVEEVDGVYQPVQNSAKKIPNKPIRSQQTNVHITHTHQQLPSNIEDLLYGFNEGLRLLSRFVKLIR